MTMTITSSNELFDWLYSQISQNADRWGASALLAELADDIRHQVQRDGCWQTDDLAGWVRALVEVAADPHDTVPLSASLAFAVGDVLAQVVTGRPASVEIINLTFINHLGWAKRFKRKETLGGTYLCLRTKYVSRSGMRVRVRLTR